MIFVLSAKSVVEVTRAAMAAARVAARVVGAMVVEARAPATFALSFPRR